MNMHTLINKKLDRILMTFLNWQQLQQIVINEEAVAAKVRTTVRTHTELSHSKYNVLCNLKLIYYGCHTNRHMIQKLLLSLGNIDKYINDILNNRRAPFQHTECSLISDWLLASSTASLIDLWYRNYCYAIRAILSPGLGHMSPHKWLFRSR